MYRHNYVIFTFKNWQIVEISKFFDQNRDFFLQLWQKSTYLEILTKIEIFEKNLLFYYKILTNIKISNRFDKISIFSKILTRMEVFQKNFLKWTFSKIWTQIQIFRKYGPKHEIFENFVPNSGFSKIS